MTTPVEMQRKFEADTEAVSSFLDAFEEWAESHEVQPSVYLPLRLILDEWLTNVAMHAYAGAVGPVDVRASSPSSSCVEVVVRDWGTAFDPLEATPPDTALDIEERDIGGLGIHFMRRMASKIQYERVGACNELSIVKSGAAS